MNGFFDDATTYTIQLQQIWEEYDPDAGLKKVPWKSELTYLYQKHEELIDLFETTYAFREISHETVERWQWYVDRKYLEIAEKYNLLFKFEKENDVSETGRVTLMEGNTDTVNEDESVPLPMAGSGNYKDKRNYDAKNYKSKMITKLGGYDNLNTLKNYMPIKNMFINEFGDLFMKTVGGIPRW